MFVVEITNCWWWNILAKLVLLRLPWNLLVFVLKYPSVMRHRSISEGVQRWRRISRYTVCQPYGRLVHFDGHDFTPMKKRVITGLGGYFSSTLLFYSRPWGSYSSLQVFTAYPGLKLIAYLFARLSNVLNHRATKNAAGSSPGFPNGRISGTPSPCYPGDRPAGIRRLAS